MLYLESFIEPFGTLWFIYLLPVFFVVTKATRRMPPLLIWVVAALLEMAHVSTGWTVIDEFARALSISIPAICLPITCSRCRTAPGRAPRWRSPALALWALVNGGLVKSGCSEWPLVSLALGLCRRLRHHHHGHAAGADAVADFLRFCGEHSIVIYLAFFLPMAATRTLLLKTGLIHDIGAISLIVTVAGVVGALAIWRIALAAGANFLFERPAAFWIAPKKATPRCRRRSSQAHPIGHRPARRVTQYSRAWAFRMDALEYWITRFRG